MTPMNPADPRRPTTRRLDGRRVRIPHLRQKWGVGQLRYDALRDNAMGTDASHTPERRKILRQARIDDAARLRAAGPGRIVYDIQAFSNANGFATQSRIVLAIVDAVIGR